MDLNRVEAFDAPTGAEAAAMAGRLAPGAAWLAGAPGCSRSRNRNCGGWST